MDIIKLNETPVRTSKNFKINNIKLDNVAIPNKITEFKNVYINGLEEFENMFNTESNIDDYEVIYGLNDMLTNQVKNDSNIKFKLLIDGKKDLSIDYRFDNDNKVLVDNIELIAEKNSDATIVINYNSKEIVEGYHNGIINVIAKSNSKLNVIIINLLNIKSNNFISIQNNLEDKADVRYTIIDFGGKYSISNYYSNLVGQESNNTINTIYLGKENQVFDLNYIAELRGQKSNVNIEVQGALKDVAKKNFKGTIDFKKGSKKAKGNENENCMLLSDKAKSIALPMLLCSEEDVEGNHSSSAGKIGNKELFYIMSRGFTVKEAQKLLVRAKFNKILDNIKDLKLKELILNEIDKRLD